MSIFCFAPVYSPVHLHPVQRLPERLGQMRLVEQDQAVRSDKAGMNRLHGMGDAVASKQQARTDLIDRRAQHRRLGRRARPVVLARDAATQAARDQGRPVAGQCFQGIGHTPGDGAAWRRERVLEFFRAREGVIHHQPAIHHKGDTNRRAPRRAAIRFQRQMKNGDIDSRCLARSGREIEHAQPSAVCRHVFEQPLLPRERFMAVNLTKEGGEITDGQHHRRSASTGRHSPSPTNRPAPRIAGPCTGSAKRITACVSRRLASDGG